jgi:hypothetical protein
VPSAKPKFKVTTSRHGCRVIQNCFRLPNTRKSVKVMLQKEMGLSDVLRHVPIAVS